MFHNLYLSIPKCCLSPHAHFYLLQRCIFVGDQTLGDFPLTDPEYFADEAATV